LKRPRADSGRTVTNTGLSWYMTKKKNIVGKLSQLDVIRGLESGYKKVGDLRGVAHSGFSPELIRSMIEKHGLWQRPLEDVAERLPRSG